MPRIESDLLEHFAALGRGSLGSEVIKIGDKTAMTLVMVSGGYPGSFEKGLEISIDESLNSSMLFHSGTTISNGKPGANDGKLVTNGGRVFALTVLGDSIDNCRSKLYALAGGVTYSGKYHRSDIGLDLLQYMGKE